MRKQIPFNPRQLPQVGQRFIAFGGGVDLVTPPLFMPSGRCRAAQNYECDINGGYGRIDGYERHDGRPAPSDANYATISVAISGAFAAGNTITGVTSAATAIVLAVVTSVTPNYLVITRIVGTFVNGETLNVAAAPQGTAGSAATIDGASSPVLHAQYKNLAADNYRASITAIPGEGSVLGVWRFAGVTYGFRNAAGGATAALYKSSSGGWTAVPLGEEISFTAGSGDIDEGDTLTRGGVTSTIKRVVITSGTLAGGTAAGRLIIHGRLGGNYTAGAATTTGAGGLTLSGAQTAITLQPSGRYRFCNENFGGSVATKRIYGCDGVNRGFEFDGTDYGYVPISTGMTDDTPDHVIAHQKQLFFGFGASVQHSGPGTPYIWSVVLGATEIGMGDNITGFAVQPGSESVGALAIFTRNRTSVLYGTGVANWKLVPYRDELGAYADTIQDVGYSVFLDDRGLTNFRTAQSFGNFAHATLSRLLKPWLNTQRTKAVASCIVRDKSQYRLFFSDQTALYVTVDGNRVVGMFQELLGHVVTCACSAEESSGSETIFIGSSTGYVYQMDVGTSFDGDAIEHYIHLAYDFLKSPRVLKTYQECVFEVTGGGYAAFEFSFELGYASTEIEQPGSQTRTIELSGQSWDGSGLVWDSLFWDGRSLAPAAMDMEGTAENVSLIVRGSSDFHMPLRFSGATIHYTTRRAMR